MRDQTFRRSQWAAPLLAALVLLVAGAAEARAVPVVAVTDSNRLIVFESSAPGSILSSVAVTGLQGGENILGIDFRPATGQLYALGSTGRLYVVNPSTGVATLQAALVADPTDASDPFAALSGTSFGVDFNPAVDRLRVVSDTDQNLRINPNNGQTITDGTLAYAAGDANAGQNPNVGGVAYINNVAAAATTTLYDIDTNRDVLVTQNPPNNGVLNTVGPLGVDVGELLGFDVAPGAAPQTAFAAMRAASGLGSSGFYRVNLSTGAATLVGNVGGGEFVRGISVMGLAQNIYAVTVTNRLLLFNSSAPGVLLSAVQITGLVGGDSILGMDFRPATGQLYAVSTGNRMYVINPQTGAATQVGGDGEFTLSGTSFGVDFNPVPDRLRVVSDADQNLRLNPNNGALAATDTPLAYAAGDPNAGQDPNIVGAAYTNSFAGAAATTLYDIDSNLDILVRQGGDPGNGVGGDPGNPNAGRLFTVGALGVDTTGEVGFDIAAGSNRAFAALNPASTTTSRLYVVNLRASTNVAAGSTILLGEIGGGEVIRDISVAPQGTFQFAAQSFSVMEDCTSVEITVTRTGDLSQPATVDFATFDVGGINPASQRSDYNAGFGTLTFESGEASKTFRVLINEDSHNEKLGGQQGETFGVTLRNATGGFFVGAGASAPVLIIDDPVEPSTNAIDDTQTFVCQHYHDFLNRDPDAPGLAFWTSQITQCGNDAACVERQRVLVSAAFFLSIEFQETGFLVYRTYAAAFGPTRVGGTVPLTIQEFLPDVQRIGRGVIVGQGDWQAQLEANKQAYFNEFVTRPAFLADYGALDNTQFVNQLGDRSGALSPAERASLINELDNGRTTRAAVLRRVAEDTDLVASQFNRAFVLMQYFGYLRRNPNDPPDTDFAGYNFWLNKLNQFNGDFVQAEMVRAFISSIEYRQRFGQ